MVVTIDTTRLGPAGRAEAMSAFLDTQVATPMMFLPGNTRGPLRLRASTVAFGDVDIVHVGGSGIRALRGPRQISASPEPTISVVQVRKGGAVAKQGPGATPTLARPGDLLLLDLTETVDILCADGFETVAIQVSFDDLGLSADAVRSTAHAPLSRSTTAGLLMRHMMRLVGRPSIEPSDAADRLLGDTAIDLLRSVVSEATRCGPDQHGTLDQTLTTRLKQYIVAHLGETTLTPQRIAGEHFISTRQLYYLWSEHDEDLTEWIIQRRLEAAHLALTTNVDGSISEIARTCGFVNTSHFNRRFRQRFGESPRHTQADADALNR